MAALTNMITETISLLTLQAAAIHQVKEVLFIGSTLLDNPTLRSALENYMSMLGLGASLLRDGEHCGALGGLLFCLKYVHLYK